ncbi:hypothetical protein A4G99_03740 [Haladaptatus sp. R4]|uniref:hypothetical protein n=1 Tax=Haladaptatus sp. R4 TaxID=1679489 RepID=UPI0007B4EF37|nr:hypothetical protein [Haladaptatus sp. R4]KZN25592.1 hypothetical protein A4G99_03740 [Haladaptatus sp. R4]
MSAETQDVTEFIEHDRELASTSPVTPLAPSQPTTLQEVSPELQQRPPAMSLPDSLLSIQPDVPERMPFESTPFWQDYERRVKNGQDLLILISDYHNDRGTGKTVLTIDLCKKMDRTDAGFTPEKASIVPQKVINGYTDHPQGSALALDEAEAGIGSREAMTKINRMMSEIVSMGRVEQKYVTLNMPASNHIDKNILDLAHYWILVQRRGLARVYSLRNNPFEKKKYPVPVQRLEWSDIDKGNPVYRALTKEKRKRLRNPGDDGSDRYVEQAEHQAIIEQVREEARRDERDAIISRILQHPKFDVSQGDIGDIAKMSQSHVSNVKQQLREGQPAPSMGD